MIAYEPEQPEREHLAQREQLAPVVTTSSTVATVMTTIAPRGVPKRLWRAASAAGR